MAHFILLGAMFLSKNNMLIGTGNSISEDTSPEKMSLDDKTVRHMKGDIIDSSGYAGTQVFNRIPSGMKQPNRLFIDNYAMEERHLTMINPDFREKLLKNTEFVKKYRNSLADAYNIGELSVGWIHPFLDPKIMSRESRMNPPPRTLV